MGTQLKKLNKEIIKFIEKQKIFFVATTTKDSYINLSPKGMNSLKVVNDNRVFWINATGSTNESSSHIQRDGRMTIMFCSFDEEPLIVKLIGRAKVIHHNDEEWNDVSKILPSLPGSRQIFDLEIEIVLTVCGMAVPYFEYKGDREDLKEWAISQGEEGLKKYWKEKNQFSLNNEPTYILDKNT